MSWAPLWLSFQIACLATLLTLVVGTALALLLRWRRLPMRDLIDAIVSTPLVLPPTVLGYYLLAVLGNDSAIGDAWEWLFGTPIIFHFSGAVVAAAVGSLPLVVRATKVGLDAVDPNLVNAARTLGARPVRVLFTVVLPLAGPGIVAGAMMGFARALGDYGATQMVASTKPAPDGIPTASIYVYEELLNSRDKNVFAMSLAMTIVGVVMLYFANRLTNRLQARDR
ncbi:MAG TPA: molybdate ABC transporter permease subunit [Kofleriaceae bacterium]